MSFGYDSLAAFSKSEIEINDVAMELLDLLDGGRDTSEVIQLNKPTTDPRADAVH